MLENISELLKVSPAIAIIIVIILQLLSQGKDIKNKNIIESRLIWLSELKSDFSNYNTSLSKIIESTSTTEIHDSSNKKTITELRQELEQNRINILLKFKPHTIEKLPSIEPLTIESFTTSILEKLKTIKNSDECEKYFIYLMDFINSYYIFKMNGDSFEHDDKGTNISDQIFLEYVEQFQTCLCKIEWNKINRESKLLNFKKIAKKIRLSLRH